MGRNAGSLGRHNGSVKLGTVATASREARTSRVECVTYQRPPPFFHTPVHCRPPLSTRPSTTCTLLSFIHPSSMFHFSTAAISAARVGLLLSLILIHRPVLPKSHDKMVEIKDVIYSAVSDAMKKYCDRTDDEVRTTAVQTMKMIRFVVIAT